MDIKIQGITKEIMDIALEQAKEARLHILDEMNKVITSHREEMSEWAPTITTFKIDPEKIRDVIGKGGAVIRAMTEETGASIDIDQDGDLEILAGTVNALYTIDFKQLSTLNDSWNIFRGNYKRNGVFESYCNPGDLNADEIYNILDITLLINLIFLGNFINSDFILKINFLLDLAIASVRNI